MPGLRSQRCAHRGKEIFQRERAIALLTRAGLGNVARKLMTTLPDVPHNGVEFRVREHTHVLESNS
jgi:hypothetical protein